MQDFGSEISQFRRFFEMKLTYGLRFVYDARVVVVHAVDVRPYLDFLTLYRRSDEAGGIVRTAALQVVHLAVCVTADEALCDVNLVSGVGRQQFVDLLFDVIEIRFGIFVRTHKVECRQQDSLYTTFL